MTQLIIQIFVPVTVAICVSIATVLLTLPKVRREKQWVWKAEEYRNILDALDKLYNYFAEKSESYFIDREISEDKQMQLAIDYRNAKRNLSRTVNIGSFTISPKSTFRIQNCLKELDKVSSEQSLFEALDESASIVKKCTDDFQVLARDDLQGSWLKTSINKLKNAKSIP